MRRSGIPAGIWVQIALLIVLVVVMFVVPLTVILFRQVSG